MEGKAGPVFLKGKEGQRAIRTLRLIRSWSAGRCSVRADPGAGCSVRAVQSGLTPVQVPVRQVTQGRMP